MDWISGTTKVREYCIIKLFDRRKKYLTFW
nr:MAG TPA_asm: hypothetical protein [Caudoviricetes sp.]DAT65755.1 MAG TPA: hypothetical protein [Caudoviricetes sp.]